MDLKIIYVNTPFWRAEVPRISLFYGSIDYEDIRISREDFLSAKKNGFTQSGHYLPFRQIPVLIINNYSLTQTGAMSRYCLLYTSPSTRDVEESRMPSSA